MAVKEKRVLKIQVGLSNDARLNLPVRILANSLVKAGHTITAQFLRSLAEVRGENYPVANESLATDFEDLATKIEEIARRQ